MKLYLFIYHVSLNAPELISDFFKEEVLIVSSDEGMQKALKLSTDEGDNNYYRLERSIKFGCTIEESKKLMKLIDEYPTYMRKYFEIQKVPKGAKIVVEYGCDGIHDFSIFLNDDFIYTYNGYSGYEMMFYQCH